MYHPHTANTASMEEIQRNIRLASSNDEHTVWIGGDFSLPEINWEDLDKYISLKFFREYVSIFNRRI
jgi:hypothetical protein